LVATDFNQDGNLDLVTAVKPPSQMQVYFGAGNGSFTSEVEAVVDNPFDPNSAAESIPSAVAADFNNDAVPDVAILAGTICGSACGTDNVHIFLSNGAGNFAFKSKSVLHANRKQTIKYKKTLTARLSSLCCFWLLLAVVHAHFYAHSGAVQGG